MVKFHKLGVFVSILLPVLLIMLIINFVYGIIPTVFQGLPVFLPLIFCPIGIVLALISYRADKNKWSKIGLVSNAVLFFVPFVWMIGGTVLFGV
ncbi:hypothetical protein [Peribacillus asahii]|uniref:hypothetical protein n=1 Tax=Peribacillus asahii TaxID=228899 RepID=UPI00382303E2